MMNNGDFIATGPRDQESQVKPEEQAKTPDRPGQHQEERTPATETDKEKDKKQQEPEDRDHQQFQASRPGGDQQKGSPQKDDDEKDDDGQREDDSQRDEESERGRTTTKQPGDDFSSPANNPYETNFEDPAQNRKTDPMTDHERRPAGI